MRKRHFLIPVLAGILLLGGCYNMIENDLSLLERRIEKLEQRCQEMNTTLEGLRAIVEKLNAYDFLTKVEPFYDGGKVAGYTLFFTHSDPVRLYNGVDAGTPVLGVAKGADGVWYWTVKYPNQTEAVFVTDNFGNRVSTASPSPMIRIENGYWMVSYDEGEIWHNLGKATGEDGASFFESIQDMGTYYQFNLLNGTSIKLPTWDSFRLAQEACRKANENLTTFSNLVKETRQRVFVHDMSPILRGTDTVGVKITLSNSNTYVFYNGIGQNTPTLSAGHSGPDDPNWYWMIHYEGKSEWIRDENGDKVRADAPESLSVKITIQRDGDDDPLYYWAVSYGDGEPEFLLVNGEKVPASQEVPQSLVQGIVSVNDETVALQLLGGEEILIPLEHALEVSLLEPVQDQILEMDARDTVTFVCRLANGDERAEVLPVAADGFFATAKPAGPTDWNICVISPDAFGEGATSKLNLIVANGYGTMKTVIVTIQYKKKKEEDPS